jgi:hypothetical protein
LHLKFGYFDFYAILDMGMVIKLNKGQSMDTAQISKIDIVGIEEINFNCAFCGTDSFPKYKVKVNEESENEHQVCLPCHNQIAKRVSSFNKKRRRNY